MQARHKTIKASQINFASFLGGDNRSGYLSTDGTYTEAFNILRFDFIPKTKKVFIVGAASIRATAETARLEVWVGPNRASQAITNSTSFREVITFGFANVTPGISATAFLRVSPQSTSSKVVVQAYQTFNLGVIEAL